MVFSSLFFVFFFLALCMGVQYFIPNVTRKNMILLGFSLAFYAWGGPKYLLLLAGMVAITWFGGCRIEDAASAKQKKGLLIATVGLDLLILAIFKYTGFLLGNMQLLTGFPKAVPEIALPIGISFYTFQLISYVADVYRGEVKAQRKYWLLLLYAGLFHQCIAGPIVRYRDVNQDILHRKVKASEMSNGIMRFSVGLAKKAILANGCATVADTLFAGDTAQLATVPVAGVWLGALAYMLEIYLDFSAYSDMAIGMGLMCGFHYKENFNYPYCANSVTDFWRRWHISLSTFFRDYVYIPLGGNRRGMKRQILNLFVVWFLTGMWHGASWNFIFWGLYYFALQMLEKFVLKEKFEQLPRFVGHIWTLMVVYFGWILFKFSDGAMLRTALAGLIGLNHAGFTDVSTGLLLRNNVFFLAFAIIAVTPLGKLLKNMLQNAAKHNRLCLYGYAVWQVACPIVLLVLSAMALAGDSYNPFLYFQF